MTTGDWIQAGVALFIFVGLVMNYFGLRAARTAADASKEQSLRLARLQRPWLGLKASDFEFREHLVSLVSMTIVNLGSLPANAVSLNVSAKPTRPTPSTQNREAIHSSMSVGVLLPTEIWEETWSIESAAFAMWYMDRASIEVIGTLDYLQNTEKHSTEFRVEIKPGHQTEPTTILDQNVSAN